MAARLVAAGKEASGSKQGALVGIDTEWRLPRMACTTLQIAVDSDAFVVDTLLEGPRASQAYRAAVSLFSERGSERHSGRLRCCLSLVLFASGRFRRIGGF